MKKIISLPPQAFALSHRIASKLQPAAVLSLCMVIGASTAGQTQLYLNRAAGGALAKGKANLPWQHKLTEDQLWNQNMKDGLESYRDGNYLKAVKSYQEASDRAKSQNLAPECQTGSLYQLGSAYQRAGRPTEAENAWKKLLTLQASDLNNPDVMRAYLALAPLYEKLNRLAEAESTYKRLLAIEEQSLGSDNPEIALGLNDLATFYERHQQQAKALELYSRILSIKKLNAQGRKCDPYIATISYRLANRYLRSNELDQAGKLFQESLNCRKLYPGRHNIDLADALMGMGLFYAAQGDNSRAERFLLESLAMRIGSLGPDDQQVATVSGIVAKFYLGIGQNTKALALLRKSLQIVEKSLGPSHPALGDPLIWLAKAQLRLGAYAQAESSLKRAVNISQGGKENVTFRKASALLALSNLYVAQCKLAEGTQSLTNAFSLFKSLHLLEAVSVEKQLRVLRQYANFPPDDLRRLRAALQLAQILIESDESITALAILAPSIEMSEKKHHALLVPLLLQQALAYQKLGDLSRAEVSALNARKVTEREQGNDGVGQAMTCLTLARLYGLQNKNRLAAESYQKALSIYKRLGHPHTSNLAKEYDSLLNRINQTENARRSTKPSPIEQAPSP